MYILGLSAFYHDSAAALVTDGRIVAAAQEERFTRKKHDARFPVNALRYCLDEAGIRLRDNVALPDGVDDPEEYYLAVLVPIRVSTDRKFLEDPSIGRTFLFIFVEAQGEKLA